MSNPTEQSEGTPDTEQNRTARPGAHAAGGIAPQADDPADQAAAARRAEADARTMRERGFGDHKGSAID